MKLEQRFLGAVPVGSIVMLAEMIPASLSMAQPSTTLPPPMKWTAAEDHQNMMDHELIALCAPRPTFISYGVPEKGDAKWLDQQGSFMAAVAAGPVFRLLGARDLGRSADYRSEKMPAVNVGLLDGQLAWRQHDGGHTDAPN